MKQCKVCGQKDVSKLKQYTHHKTKKLIICNICKLCAGNIMANISKKRWDNPAFKNKMIKKRNDKDYKRKISDSCKETWSNEELKQKHSEKMKSVYSCSEKRSEMSKRAKELWEDENYRNKTIASHKKRCESKEERERLSKQSKKKYQSDEYKEKFSKNMKEFWSNPKNVKEMKRKHRERIAKQVINNKISPHLGKNETKILDSIEEENNVKIIRQFPVIGYFVDGYDKENNICYEIDERHHLKQIDKDIQRQKEITEYLNCEFVRIPDY